MGSFPTSTSGVTMQRQNRGSGPQLEGVPPQIAIPTEAEARAADLEKDEVSTERLRQDREARIREAGYARHAQRGRVPRDEEEDWLAAEREVDRGGREKRLTKPASARPEVSRKG
jgi:hypothetical protein